MGNCKPRVIDTDSKYYFNDIDDMATEAIGGAIPENINNASNPSATLELQDAESVTPGSNLIVAWKMTIQNA